MRRISSGMTFFYKRVFPVLWVGFTLLVVLIFVGIVLGGGPRTPPFFVILFPLAFLLFGLFIMRKLVFDLMDEVYDADDHLIVRNKGAEERIDLTNIINVSYAAFVNPRRITLTLRQRGRFGDKVAFSPLRNTVSIFSFSNRLADDLVRRIDAGRQSQPGLQ